MSKKRVALGAQPLEQGVDLVEEEIEPAAAPNGRRQDVGMPVVGALGCADEAQCSAERHELASAGVGQQCAFPMFRSGLWCLD